MCGGIHFQNFFASPRRRTSALSNSSPFNYGLGLQVGNSLTFFRICVICVICGCYYPCRNFNTAALNSADFSNCGTCPHWSITKRVELGISFLNLSPSAGGVNPSSRPHTTSVGCLMDLTRLSRKSSPRMIYSMMLVMV